MESALHNMVDLFESDNSTAVLHIVVMNDSNSFNRNVFLRNTKAIFPDISDFIINFHSSPSHLFVRGKGELKLKEEGPRKAILLQCAHWL